MDKQEIKDERTTRGIKRERSVDHDDDAFNFSQGYKSRRLDSGALEVDLTERAESAPNAQALTDEAFAGLGYRTQRGDDGILEVDLTED